MSWKKFSEEQPCKSGDYLYAYDNESISIRYWDNKYKRFSGSNCHVFIAPIYWAELNIIPKIKY